MPGKGREWGYASYYEDEETGETRLIYTSYEKDGSVNRYTDNGDGGHGHAHWNSRDDFDMGEEPDWCRRESNSSPNPDDSEIQENGGCYLTTACMHKYKGNFDDNCYELTVLRWFRDNHITLAEKYHYYKVAPKIVAGINASNHKMKYYQFIYEQVVKASVEAIERGELSFAYNRYKRTVQMLENKFVGINKDNVNINSKESENVIKEEDKCI